MPSGFNSRSDASGGQIGTVDTHVVENHTVSGLLRLFYEVQL